MPPLPLPDDPFQVAKQFDSLRAGLATPMAPAQTQYKPLDLGQGSPTPNGSGVALADINGDGHLDLVDVGRGFKLARPAADAYFRATQFAPGGIILSSGHRTNAQQTALYKQKPGLAAKPGHSLHEQGIAIDVSNWRQARDALTKAGWRQFDPHKEPWHFSYGRTG